eukprot:TRINITY_DN1356_c0_g1_i1.p1 TRINITY_DN1356_c0_g1~~TRINITY_DN1356_c0_g1_i1.p1  ORF type:complete len:107 (+),score=11.46 TRINITY_DN1356_c0_g1_i1:622-942(+)
MTIMRNNSVDHSILHKTDDFPWKNLRVLLEKITLQLNSDLSTEDWFIGFSRLLIGRNTTLYMSLDLYCTIHLLVEVYLRMMESTDNPVEPIVGTTLQNFFASRTLR